MRVDTKELVERLGRMAFYLTDAPAQAQTPLQEESIAAWKHMRDDLKDECRAILDAMITAGIVGLFVDLDSRIFQARPELNERGDEMLLLTLSPFGEELRV